MEEQFIMLFGILKTSLELIAQHEERWDKYRMRNTALCAMNCVKEFCGKNQDVNELVNMADKYVEQIMRR